MYKRHRVAACENRLTSFQNCGRKVPVYNDASVRSATFRDKKTNEKPVTPRKRCCQQSHVCSIGERMLRLGGASRWFASDKGYIFLRIFNTSAVMSDYVYTPGISVNYFADTALSRAIRSTNCMRMLGANDSFPPYKHLVEDQIGNSMLNSSHSRDGADKCGKISLCLMAKVMGVQEEFLVVDPAQAGGLLGKSDGAVVAADGTMIPIEIKGTRSKKGKIRTFQINSIRLKGH